MKSLLKKLWGWLKSIFTTDESKSALLKVLMEGIDDPALDIIKDPDLGKKAIQFVKELNKREDLTGKEKAEIFNAKLYEYAKAVGKVIGSVALNLLRELTVTAVRIAITNAAASLVLAQVEKEKVQAQPTSTLTLR